MMDAARHGARSFVLAALRALHLAPFRVAVRGGYCAGRADGEVVKGPVRGVVSRA
jgi:hypothetical protein